MTMPSEPGWYEGVPFLDYLAWPAINASMLGRFYSARSPKHFHHEWSKAPDSLAMRQGRAVHAAIFEPDAFDEEYFVTDVSRRGTKAWAEMELEQAGKVIFKESEWAPVQGMIDALRSHPRVQTILAQDGHPEVSGLAHDTEFGCQRKIRLDWRVPGPEWQLILDLKTTRDASEWGFVKQVVDLNYDLKAAWYHDTARLLGDEPRSHVFIAVEKEPPHAISFPRIGADSNVMVEGRHKYQTALRGLLWCLKTEEWPGYDESFYDLDVDPKFRTREAEREWSQ